MQGVSAIAFVFILAVGFNLAAGDLSQSRWYVEKTSAVLIGGFGTLIIWQALKRLRPTKFRIRGLRPAEENTHSDARCCGHHSVGIDLHGSSWRTPVQRRDYDPALFQRAGYCHLGHRGGDDHVPGYDAVCFRPVAGGTLRAQPDSRSVW